MSYLRKSVLVACCFLFIILTGCKKEVDQEEVFKDIYKNMKTQYNFYYRLKVSKISGEKTKDVSYIMFMDMTSKDEGIIEYQKNLGFKTINGYYNYNGENATHFYREYGSWEKETQSVSNIDDDMLYYYYFYEVLNGYTSFEEVGSETLSNGVKVTQFTLIKDLPDLIRIILGSDFDELGLTEEELAEVTKDIECQVYLDIEAKLIRKIDLNLSDTILAIIEKAKEKDSSIDINITLIEADVIFNYFGEFDLTIRDSIKNDAVDVTS